ncbi:sensor histidine kinase [Kineococcus sp. SYSU DK004]|uniref:sensor histidine kinase n=1 Tax=Kineococcus sp. SYSU DK004 TaxID=3383125 RepID=UPI003D7C99A7
MPARPDRPGGAGGHRPHPHALAALAVAAVALALLAWLPVAAAADPSLGAAPALASPSWWAAAAVVAAQSVLVARVARRPALLLPLTAALPLPLALAAPSAVLTLTTLPVAVATHLAVLSRPLRRLAGALAATLLLVALAQVLGQTGDEPAAGGGPWVPVAAGTAQALLVVGAPLLLGSVVAARRDAERARRQEVAALRREQEALLAAAVSQQRTAMSRELHDIAAHHLSGIALLAAAIGRQVDTDPAAAKRSAQLVREQSRAVLDDLRRLVGLLREDAADARPVETLAGLDDLVRARRAVGADVALVHRGDGAERLGPLAQLVAHRAVQEALANAAAHAPGAVCAVEVDATASDRVVLTVRNGPPTGPDQGPGSGFGLVAMAERAQLVGGTLEHGPTGDGGWRVRLRLPAEPAARPDHRDDHLEGTA